VTDECIHGFPTELCDICSPRQRAEPLVPVKPAPRRTKTSLRSVPTTTSGRSRGAAQEPPARVFTTLRAHHWTHLDNLASIVADGAIRSSVEATPDIDVSAPETRARRAEATAPDGSPVAAHVPFTLSADARSWDDVRAGAAGSRWSDAARRTRGSDYVMLVVPVTAFGESVIVADREADDPAARFAAGPDAATKLLRRTDLTDPEMLELELLAGPEVPLSSVAVVGVPNDRTRDAVRDILSDAGEKSTRVAIFPPWFHAAASDTEE